VDQTRCLVWMGELVDVEKLDSTFGENLYLRVPRSPGIYFSSCTLTLDLFTDD